MGKLYKRTQDTLPNTNASNSISNAETMETEAVGKSPFLFISQQPREIYYNCEGGRGNFLEVYFQVIGEIPSQIMTFFGSEGKIPITAKVFLENGKEISASKALRVLGDCKVKSYHDQTPLFDLKSKAGSIRFRYQICSRKMRNQKFKLKISLPFVDPVFTSPTLVLSKRRVGDRVPLPPPKKMVFNENSYPQQVKNKRNKLSPRSRKRLTAKNRTKVLGERTLVNNKNPMKNIVNKKVMKNKASAEDTENTRKLKMGNNFIRMKTRSSVVPENVSGIVTDTKLKRRRDEDVEEQLRKLNKRVKYLESLVSEFAEAMLCKQEQGKCLEQLLQMPSLDPAQEKSVDFVKPKMEPCKIEPEHEINNTVALPLPLDTYLDEFSPLEDNDDSLDSMPDSEFQDILKEMI